jgi:hypothetical protein
MRDRTIEGIRPSPPEQRARPLGDAPAHYREETDDTLGHLLAASGIAVERLAGCDCLPIPL